jgi:bifunctional DNA-binding transcriptional regulator/antitoxin component of YhaV-PrlF toxin-antitoxin module
MQTTYTTTVIGQGNHASLEIPPKNLAAIGGNKRAPLKITINGYTYQSTATGVDGKCMVVFPTRDRATAGVKAGDKVTVTLELDAGYREVEIPAELVAALKARGLRQVFDGWQYFKRKEAVRQVAEAKAEDTKARRIQKILDSLSVESTLD